MLHCYTDSLCGVPEKGVGMLQASAPGSYVLHSEQLWKMSTAIIWSRLSLPLSNNFSFTVTDATNPAVAVPHDNRRQDRSL